MQSYEAAGGYGLPDYYNMGMGGNAYSNNAYVAAVPKRGGMGGMRGSGMMRGGMGGMGMMGGGGFGGGMGGRFNRGGGRGGMGGRGAARGGRFNPLASASKGKSGGTAPPGHIVFAYNIGPMTGEDDVRQLFELYGTVVKVDVIWDYAKNQGKGYAFVTMPDFEEASYAIQQLNGYNYAGKPLQVSFKSNKQGGGGSQASGGNNGDADS